MIFAVLVLTAISIFLYVYCDYRKYPPGPWNLPIIGYLHKLDPVSPHLSLTKVAQKYGPICRMKFGLVNTVLISDAKLLKKILIKDETLERPRFLMINVITGAKGLGFAPLSLWKDTRKFTTNFLRIVGATKFSSNKKNLEDLITNYAEGFVHHVKSQGNIVNIDSAEDVVHYVSGITGTLILGQSFSRHDEVQKNLIHHLDTIMHLGQFAGPLNFLPFLRFLPRYRKTLTRVKEMVDRVRTILRGYIKECERTFCNDATASNFIEAFLLQRSKGGATEIYNIDQLTHLIFDIFTAGTETTVNSILWTVLYLAQYQKVQDKVRQELFDVLHDKQLEMTDLPRLSYTQATITEAARIRTVIPLGTPHYATEDIYIDDIIIRKGTTIMPLLWAIHMDPNVWDKPEEFRPGRFLNEDQTFTPQEAFIPFQSGKRMCVGDEFARMMIYIFIANLLRNFKIEPCESGPVDLSEICGLTLVPKSKKFVLVKI